MTALLEQSVAATRIAAARAVMPDLASRAAQHDRDGSFPFESFRTLAEANLLNLTVPSQYGGDGLGLDVARQVIQHVAQGDPSVALVLTMQYMTHANVSRERHWPEQVYRRVVESSLRGIALTNSLRVEPELGTPARGGLPATTARRVADGWRISGHKIYATGIPILHWLVVWARTDDETPRVGQFLVPADAPGIRIEESWDHLGMRATGSHDAILTDVPIPAEYAVDLRAPAAWAERSVGQAAWNAVLVSSVYHGVALAARDWLVRYLHERVPSNLGAPLASLPRFQTAVGQIQAVLHASDRMLTAVAQEADVAETRKAGAAEAGAADESSDAPAVSLAQSATLAKLTATNNAIQAVEIGLTLIGNPGLSRRNPLERHYRDVLCSRVHTPQDDSILAAAGRTALEAARPNL